VHVEKLAGASLLIFANKQDLKGALDCEQIKVLLDLNSEKFANRHWQIHPCSAVTGEVLRSFILVVNVANLSL
jgi:ADP-ribosylation factor-like protein 2